MSDRHARNAPRPPESGPLVEPFKFDVFISYSRRDLAFARRLHRALDNYTPPRDLRVPQRRLRVFRDESDFRGNEYASALDSVLASAGKMLVICSPNSRASAYVGAEIASFASLRGQQHIVSVLLAGRPNNEAGGDGSEQAFHEELVARLPIPLAADYRGWDEKRDRIDRDRFESAWFKLLVDLYADHGVERSELEEREKQRQRRTRRIRAAVVSAVMVVLAALTVWALFSRNQAIIQGNTARSRFLAIQSMTATQPFDVAMLLAVAAYRTAPTFEAWEALFVGLQRQPNLERFLFGATDTVDHLAIAPGGACAVASTRDQRSTVWDLASGARRLDIAGRALPDPSCTSLVVALPDGRLEGRSLRDGQPSLWSEAPAGGRVTAWAADTTGTLLAVAYDGGRVQVRDVKDGRVRTERAGPATTWRYLRFSADGQSLIAIDQNSQAHRWDASQLTGPARTARCSDTAPDIYAVSPDLGWCAAGGPGQFSIRDLTRDDAQTLDLGTEWVLALDFSPDGRTLMAGVQGGDLKLWPVEALVKNGQSAKPAIWSEHRSDVTAAAYAADGRTVISAARDRTVVVWSSRASARLVSETALDPRPAAIASDPDSRRLAVGTSAGEVLVSKDGSPSSFERVASVGEPVTAVALGVTGSVVVGTEAGHLFLVNAAGPPRPMAAEPQKRVVRIRLSEDQTRAGVMFADGSVKIWNIATTQVVADVAAAGRGVAEVGRPDTGADIAFEPGGTRLALVRGGREAHMWDARSSQLSALPFKPTSYFTSVAAAGGGGPLALGTGMYEEEIVLLDPVQTGAPTVRLASQNLQKIAVTALAFSPDHRILFSGLFDGTTSTWDVAGRRRFGAIHRARGAIIDLSYARDGFAVTAVTDQGMALRWNLDPADWMKRACAIANRRLSPEEHARFLDDASASPPCS